MHRDIPFIAVEGAIGVGKTSLASLISDHYQFHLLEEMFEENPFLSKFYKNIEEWSFQTEMFFLSTRYKQLDDIRRSLLNQGHPVVSDYHSFKNLIFSKLTLNETQYRKYTEMYRILMSDMPKPNIVIYIRASHETLLRRVHKRNRDIERSMSAAYLQRLSVDYDHFIDAFQTAHPEVAFLVFDADELDFVARREDLQHILNRVDEVLESGFRSSIRQDDACNLLKL